MTNKIWSLIKVVVALAVSANSHAQDTVYFGLRLGVQHVPELCKARSDWESCNDSAAIANPYLRFNIVGPHNIEIGARATLADYQGSVGDASVSMSSSSLSLSYEVRPFSGQEPGPIAVRLGWHYTTYNFQGLAFNYRTNSTDVAADSTDDNGFIVGLGFDPFRHVNLAFDYADWDGDEAMSLMLGFEI